MSTSPPPRQPFSRAAEARRYGRAPVNWQSSTPAGSAKNIICTAWNQRPRWSRAPYPTGKRRTESLFWRQHHDHLPSLETGIHLDLRYLLCIAFEAIEQPDAEFLVRHFATAEAQRHLDLVAFPEEANHRAHLHIVIVIVDHRAKFDFLDFDDLLLLARFRLLLLLLKFVLAKIKQLADRRLCVRRNLAEVTARLSCTTHCLSARRCCAVRR